MTAADDVRTLEACADELMRLGSAREAVKLYAIALKIRCEQADTERYGHKAAWR